MMTSMRPVVFLVILLSLGSSVTPSVRSDKDAVRSIVSTYVNERNAKSPERVRSLFTNDADQLVSSGEWRHGANDLIRGMMASSKKEQANSSVSITDVRMIDPDVAIVDGRYRTTSLDGAIRDMWTTFILKRTGDEWRIAAIRNMKPAPAKPGK